MFVRRRGTSRAATALVLPLALLIAGLAALAGWNAFVPARAAYVAGGALPGLGNGRIWSVAVDPASPATLLAGTDAGVYRSENSGQSWSQTTLRGRRVWTVGFDLRKPNPAFAGGDGGGIARSDDAGRSWTDASGGLPGRTVRSLAFGLGLVVAGTNDGVAVSPDGRAWRSIGLTGYDVSSVAVAANTPKISLIAGVDGVPPGAAPGYLFRNVGPGTQWESLLVGPQTAVVSHVAAGPLPAATNVRPLLVCTNQGVYRSGDGGANWTKTFPPANADVQTQTLTTAVFSPIDPNLVFAGDDAGGSGGGTLARSLDGGATFAADDTGLPNDREAASIAVAPLQPPLVVIAVDPPDRAASIYTKVEQGVPPPAPTATPEPGSVLPALTPPPTARATPAATPPPSDDQGGEGPVRRLVDWPIPLAVELLTILAAVALVGRWRRRRLHIEGPP